MRIKLRINLITLSLVVIVLLVLLLVLNATRPAPASETAIPAPIVPSVVESEVGRIPAIGTLPSVLIVDLQITGGDAKELSYRYLDEHKHLGAVGITAESDDGSQVALAAVDPLISSSLTEALVARLGIGDNPSALVQDTYAGFNVFYVYRPGESAGINAYAASFLSLAGSTKIVCSLDDEGLSRGYPESVALFIIGGTRGRTAVALAYDVASGVIATSGSIAAFSSQGDLQNHVVELGELFTGGLRVLVAQDDGGKGVTGVWQSITNPC